MQRSTTDPDDYIASLPSHVRDEMVTLDAVLASVFDGDERVLWDGRPGQGSGSVARVQSGNASGPRSESSRACSPESSGGIQE